MGKPFIKVASVYLLIGISFGVYMGITENFDYGHTHAHINLLGWATMAVFGLIYCVFPRAETSKLGKIHFGFTISEPRFYWWGCSYLQMGRMKPH